MTDTRDVEARLRAASRGGPRITEWNSNPNLFDTAADLLSSQRGEIERLREALDRMRRCTRCNGTRCPPAETAIERRVALGGRSARPGEKR